uniref:Membrane-spanning 4-domains subfamily A member 4A-like n=1 Tax=Ailuropoda melanoleuca TaxID=9646 RepID=A0A7N5KEC9_AILME
MQSHAGTLQAETAQDDTTNLPENESITQLRHLGTWVLPSQWQKSLLLFLKGQPQVLGAAQILIGLLTLCLGVTISPFSPYDYGHRCCMITNTGYHVWGSFSFLVSGALSVAAGRKVTKCLIQGSLGMNTVSAIVAGFGTSLIILEELVMYGNRIWRSSRGSLFIMLDTLLKAKGSRPLHLARSTEQKKLAFRYHSCLKALMCGREC